MLSLLRLLFAGFIATALGLAATWYSVRHVRSVTSVSMGPWRATPANATLAADPYARAHMAFTGTVPFGLGEGIALSAHRDSKGQILTGSCTYRLAGEMPSARFWTLTATAQARGTPVPRPSSVPDAESTATASMTSGDAVWMRRSPIAVVISRQPQPGNWLALAHSAPFVIKLRLYDTGAAFVGPSTAPTMPALVRESCP